MIGVVSESLRGAPQVPNGWHVGQRGELQIDSDVGLDT
jgi:hypothetical protein